MGRGDARLRSDPGCLVTKDRIILTRAAIPLGWATYDMLDVPPELSQAVCVAASAWVRDEPIIRLREKCGERTDGKPMWRWLRCYPRWALERAARRHAPHLFGLTDRPPA